MTVRLANGASASLSLRLLAAPSTVALVPDPPDARLSAVLAPGGATVVTLRLRNAGNAPSG